MNECSIIDLFDKKLIIEHLYCIGKYHTMTFRVMSKEFHGKSSFCISNDILLRTLEALESMATNFTGNVQFRDTESDAEINVEMKRFGKAEISGQIGGSHQDHYMRFKFESDQTVLIGLIKFVKQHLVT